MATNDMFGSPQGAGGAWNYNTLNDGSRGQQQNWLFNGQGYSRSGDNELLPRYKEYGQFLNPLVGQGMYAMSQAYPGYYNQSLANFNHYSTPQGVQEGIDQSRHAALGAAGQAGQIAGNQVAMTGGGIGGQQGAQLSATNQANQGANDLQSYYATPQGQQAHQQALQALLGGVSYNPAYSMQGDVYNQILGGDSNYRAQGQYGRQGGMLGSLAGIAGTLAPMMMGGGAGLGGMMGGMLGGMGGGGGSAPSFYGGGSGYFGGGGGGFSLYDPSQWSLGSAFGGF